MTNLVHASAERNPTVAYFPTLRDEIGPFGPRKPWQLLRSRPDCDELLMAGALYMSGDPEILDDQRIDTLFEAIGESGAEQLLGWRELATKVLAERSADAALVARRFAVAQLRLLEIVSSNGAPIPPAVGFSMFANARDESPSVVSDATWLDLLDALCDRPEPIGVSNDASDAEIKRIKETCCQGFAPAVFDGGGRSAKNTKVVSCFVGDIDSIDDVGLSKLLALLERHEWAHVLTETFSSRLQGRPLKLRLVMPYSRAITASEHLTVWDRMIAAVAEVAPCDTACKDPNRMYFTGLAPAETVEQWQYWIGDGNAIDVDALLTAPREPTPTAAARAARASSTLISQKTARSKAVCFRGVTPSTGGVPAMIAKLARLPDGRQSCVALEIGPAIGASVAHGNLTMDAALTTYLPLVRAALEKSHALSPLTASVDSYMTTLEAKIAWGYNTTAPERLSGEADNGAPEPAVTRAPFNLRRDCDRAAKTYARRTKPDDRRAGEILAALAQCESPSCTMLEAVTVVFREYRDRDPESVAVALSHDSFGWSYDDVLNAWNTLARDEHASLARVAKHMDTYPDLLRDNDGGISSTAANTQMLVEADYVRTSKLRMNVRGELIQLLDADRGCWRNANDYDLSELVKYLQLKHSVVAQVAGILAPVRAAAATKSVDPFIDWLESLPEWDGLLRLSDLLTRSFGGESSVYTRAAARCFVMQMLARAYLPGCKAELKLVLVGAQDMLKSSWCELVVGSEFFDGTQCLKKDGPDELLKLHQVVLHEDQEMDTYSKKDVKADKAHLSNKVDMFRAPYGTTVGRHPRRFVEVGTYNPIAGVAMLHDETGGRRYLPFDCTKAADLAWVSENRDQLFAEALSLFRQLGAPDELQGVDQQALKMHVEAAQSRGGSLIQWWLSEAEKPAAREVVEAHTDVSPFVEPLVRELAKPVRPDHPLSMSDAATEHVKFNSLHLGNCWPEQIRKGSDGRSYLIEVSINQALTVLGLSASDKSAATRISTALLQAGWAYAGRVRRGSYGQLSVYRSKT